MDQNVEADSVLDATELHAKLVDDADLSAHEVFNRVGSLTRKLHDALRELGYDREIEGAVGSLPDARARLSYIADLTGKAADRVLEKVEDGIAADDKLAERAQHAIACLAASTSSDQKAVIVQELSAFVLAHCDSSRGRLTEIMMAQDFHDLTGQVVKKVAHVAQTLEEQLIKLLLDMTPPDQRQAAPAEALEGPVIDKSRADVVHGQEQVDDLLDSLGF